MVKKLYNIFKNKYVIFILIVLVWGFFIDDNGIKTSLVLNGKKKELQEEKLFLQEKITQDSANIEMFKNNLSEYEKYGRENYYMKRQDEDIFIVTKEAE
ncbi:MAG: hypothetical protein IKY22_07435 [Bacteroidales bacterium]|nr:hypothetical protein [Bacteroidales bacterium]